MSDVNVVTVSGRLTKEPELRQTNNGTDVASFRLANNMLKKTNFFDVSLWGRSAATLAQHGSKGSWISLTGRLEQDEWEDKEGNRRTSYKISSDNFNFMGGGKDNNSGTETQYSTSQATTEDSTVPF